MKWENLLTIYLMVSYLLHRGFVQADNTPKQQEIFPATFLPYSDIFYESMAPLEQVDINPTAIDAYCKHINHVFLGTVSKPPEAKAIDMVAQGVVLQKPADAEKIDESQVQAFYQYRSEVIKKQEKQRAFISNKIVNALKMSHRLHQLNAQDPLVQLAVDTIMNQLIVKFEIYAAALEHQKTPHYVNCREYADHAAALFLRAQLEDENIGSIQRFRVSLGPEGLNHAFVVLNSGVSPTTIENNPEAVAALLAEIDTHSDAHLCDFGYNREVGPFNEIRDKNKFYGKNISHPWTCLDIVAVNPDIDLSSIPERAVELRSIITKLNDDINEKIRKNIHLPQYHTQEANKPF